MAKKNKTSKVVVDVNGNGDVWVRRIVAISKLVATLTTLVITIIHALK